MTFEFSAVRVVTAGLAAVGALLASACGGGGGSTTASTPPPSSNPPNPPPTSTLISNPPRTCETQGNYTLCVIVQDTRTKPETVGHMKDQFFNVYPRLVERFNPAAPRTVNFTIGPAGFIAGASGDQVTYQTEWMLQHPEDYDVVVHEIMHIVQSYTADTTPGWLTEGIADYVRNQYGVNNAAAGWSLQMPTAASAYTDGYGTTGRFILWLEARYDLEFAEMLDTAVRSGSYVPSSWISYTGKSVDELWQDYVADPVIATG